MSVVPRPLSTLQTNTPEYPTAKSGAGIHLAIAVVGQFKTLHLWLSQLQCEYKLAFEQQELFLIIW